MLVNYDLDERRKEKMLEDDRILVLKPLEGKKALSASLQTDGRLFTGENKLHVVYNDFRGMWMLNYSVGALPGGLQGMFTTFTEAVNHARQYFLKRNVEITDIIQ